jgi:hypothetical protein
MDETTKIQLHDRSNALAGFTKNMILIVDETEHMYAKDINEGNLKQDVENMKVALEQLNHAVHGFYVHVMEAKLDPKEGEENEQ